MQTNTTQAPTVLPRKQTNPQKNGFWTQTPDTVELKTQGEIEAQVGDVLRRYSLEYTGRGPEDVHAHLVGDLVIVKMSGVLTVTEQHLAVDSTEQGNRLIKLVRSHLLEMAREDLTAAIRSCTLVDVLGLHQDISPMTGEEILVFTLSASPVTRPTKRK